MNCEFCKKSFFNKSTMKRHQTTKYCLLIQETAALQRAKKSFVCVACDKQLSTKHCLVMHHNSCKKYKNEISQPPSRTNTLTLHLQPLTSQSFDNCVLTMEHIKKGAVGYAECAMTVFKDKLVCTDYSRRVVKYKDEHDTVVTDPNMVTTMTMYIDSIIEKNRELINNCWVGMCNNDDDIDRLSKLSGNLVGIQSRTPLYNDIIKEICSRTKK